MHATLNTRVYGLRVLNASESRLLMRGSCMHDAGPALTPKLPSPSHTPSDMVLGFETPLNLDSEFAYIILAGLLTSNLTYILFTNLHGDLQ